MSYPTIRLEGQYTLQRVLTLPNNTGTPVTTVTIGKPVSVNSDGEVILPAAGEATFWGILRAVESDGYCSVDFSGVHKLTSDAAINAGTAVTVTTGGKVIKATSPDTAAVTHATKAVALTKTTGTVGESLSVFILN